MTKDQNETKARPPVYCSIDTTDLEHALALAAAMQKAGCGIKLGLEFFNAHGPAGVREIMESYPEISLFIDLKYHDIPNTVAGAIRGIIPLAPDFINIHASGGYEMIQRAADATREESENVGVDAPQLLAVTILTSLDEDALAEIGYQAGVSDRVKKLASLSQKAGADGVVCSPREIEIVRKECGHDFTLMVPGIRPAGSDQNDQKRVMTPEEAMHIGASHLVIGRPITQSANPGETAAAICQKLIQRAA